MKKITYLAATLFLVAIFTGSVIAQGTQQQNRTQDPETHATTSPSPTGNQVKNQNQVTTQNMGEETQLQVATSEMEQLSENMDGTNQNLGNQIKTIAQEQIVAQQQIQNQVEKLDSKPAILKGIFGTSFGAIKNLKAQIEQNRLRIQNLTELKNQVTNQADETQLETAIQALIDQNTSLEEKIQAEEDTTSLLGWLIKLFYQ